MKGPLSGVKVLELATFVAAPSCTRLLSDLGATVIKVEHPNGDLWRKTSISYIPNRFSDEENPVFDIYNTGKKHIAIDLKTEKGMEVFRNLLGQSDVFVTNTRPKSLKKLGISYDDVKDDFPGLIYSCVLGYGEHGPDASKPAFDTTAFWARSGFLLDMSVVNEKYYPIMPPFGVGDALTGILLMGEICAALYRRLKTGKGDYVRSGLYHNSIFSMATMLVTTQRPFGTTYPKSRIDHGIPGGIYQCSDGQWVFLATSYGPLMIPALYKALDLNELSDDPRFVDEAARWRNNDEFYAIISNRFLTKTSKEWVEIFEAVDLPLTIMNHFADVSEDEQAWANGYLEKVEFSNGNVDVVPRSPIEMDSVSELKTVPARPIGADTKEILTQLGYTDTQIDDMHSSGIIRKDN